jgi:uncharacterized Zn finger protein (UPF0148 family)
VRKIAQDEVSKHSFSTQINKSVAEGTIERYTVKCWGCDRTGHSFANKQGQITCPNKDKPGVQDRAAKARKDFKERLQKRKQESKKKRGVNNMLTEAFGSLTGDEIRALVASSSPAKKTENSLSGAAQTFTHQHRFLKYMRRTDHASFKDIEFFQDTRLSVMDAISFAAYHSVLVKISENLKEFTECQKTYTENMLSISWESSVNLKQAVGIVFTKTEMASIGNKLLTAWLTSRVPTASTTVTT